MRARRIEHVVTVGDLIAENAGLRAELQIARAELELREAYEHNLKAMLHVAQERYDSLAESVTERSA